MLTAKIEITSCTVCPFKRQDNGGVCAQDPSVQCIEGVPHLCPNRADTGTQAPVHIPEEQLKVIACEIAKLIKDDITYSHSLRKRISIKEAQMIAGVKSRTTILKWIHAGDIYAVKKPGSNWIIDRDSIDAFLDNEKLQF